MERWTPRARFGFVFEEAARLGAVAGAAEAGLVLAGAHGPDDASAAALLGVVSVVLGVGVATVLSVLAGPVGDDTVRGVSRQLALAATALVALLSWERFGWALGEASRVAAVGWAVLPLSTGAAVYLVLSRRAGLMRARSRALTWGTVALVCGVLVGAGTFVRPATRAPGPSALVITVEGVPGAAVGAGDLPRLDGLAAASVVFAHAITPSTSTGVAHAALWSDRHPLTLGLVRDDQVLPPDSATVAERARQAGLVTAAFVSTTALSDLGLDRGFDTYDDGFAPMAGLDRLALVRWLRGLRWLRRDPPATAAGAVAWLGAHQGERFLLWVHLAPPSSAVRDGGHLGSLDAAIGEVIDGLGPAASRTLVVVAGVRGARSTPGATPWAGVADEVVRVPLVLSVPGWPAPATLDGQVGLTQAGAEIAAWLTLPPDVSAPRLTSVITDGADGLRPSRATTVIGDDGAGHTKLALRQADLKVVVDPDSQDAAYYDLSADPLEETDRSGQAPEFVLQARMSLAPELAALVRAREAPGLGGWRARRLRALAEE